MNQYVTTDMQAMFWPLNLMQNILFCPKYGIKNNYISPNTFQSNLISVLAAIVFIVTYCCRCCFLFLNEERAFASGVNVVFLCVFEVSFYTVGFLINAIASVTQTNDHIHFIIIIQKVVILFKHDLKKNTICNWISVVIFLVFSITYITCGYLLYEGTHKSLFWSIILLLSFDINMIYAISLLNFLQENINIWNNAVLSSGDNRDQHMCRKLFQAYVRILECYNICNRTFGILVS